MEGGEGNSHGRDNYAKSLPGEKCAKMEKVDTENIFAEASFDTFWETGLDVTGTKGANIK